MFWKLSLSSTEVSPAITSIGVWSRTLSTRGVTMLVSAGPWVTVATPSSPVVRAKPLAATRPRLAATPNRSAAELSLETVDHVEVRVAQDPEDVPDSVVGEGLGDGFVEEHAV
jgi:hypothetical protein